MSTTPVGYEAFQSTRRKAVSLLCLILASTMAMGISVYVDSYSVYRWDEAVDAGACDLLVYGEGVGDILESVQEIDGISIALPLLHSDGFFTNANHSVDEKAIFYHWAQIGLVSEELFENFPDLLVVENGRMPESDSEIALADWAAHRIQICIGDVVNNSIGGRDVGPFQLLTVVGIFSVPNTEKNLLWRGRSPTAYVTELETHNSSINTMIIGGIDKSRISPFFAHASLNFLTNIEESIRRLEYPYVSDYWYGRYQVYGQLTQRVRDFVLWRDSTRLTQLFRTAGASLLVILIVFLSIRYNMNSRRYEAEMLMARGASKRDVERSTYKEIFRLSLIGTLIGFMPGVVISRIGMAADGFLIMDFARIWTEPLLISFESLIVSFLVGILLPILTLILYQIIYSTKKRMDEPTGRLAKVGKGLALIKWDALVLVFSFLLIFTFYTAEQAILSIPILGFMLLLILTISPLTVFLAISSLFIKALRRGANRLSDGLESFVGKIPALIGIRRAGKSASSAGPVAVILVLAMSMAWTSAVIAESLPATKVNHARLSFGSDLTFHLERYTHQYWDDFFQNVTNHPQVESASLLTVTRFLLSSESYRKTSLVGIEAEDLLAVGYDYLGIPLNESTTGNYLHQLAKIPTGAIITKDISEDYQLAVGDTLRAYSIDGSEISVFMFNIVAVIDALSDFSEFSTDDPYASSWRTPEIGTNNIWVNRDYLSTVVNLTQTGHSKYCVRLNLGANVSAVVEDILNSGATTVLGVGGKPYTSVAHELQFYVERGTYLVDRSVDTIVTIVCTFVVFGAFSVYAAEDLRAKRREIALMRAMGAHRRMIIGVQFAEMVILSLSAILLLLVYAPIQIGTASLVYSPSNYIYPVSIFLSIPWFTLGVVLSFFLMSTLVFIFIVSIMSSKIHIATALNASWAESGPYGGKV